MSESSLLGNLIINNKIALRPFSAPPKVNTDSVTVTRSCIAARCPFACRSPSVVTRVPRVIRLNVQTFQPTRAPAVIVLKCADLMRIQRPAKQGHTPGLERHLSERTGVFSPGAVWLDIWGKAGPICGL